MLSTRQIIPRNSIIPNKSVQSAMSSWSQNIIGLTNTINVIMIDAQPQPMTIMHVVRFHAGNSSARTSFAT